ncbi:MULTISPECIES: TraR/DksA C4-type zinc finger protein [Bacillus]|uniref:General stress protein n=1 Tax=Bacillus glycinifermentans TaxID=1664069 RepID=A0AAJ4D334_9BACI|nr:MULTISPECIES: TraR/DksA C4-type zinc finger protein [Bacillus]KKB74954.1 general stress protein [Bacillus sp. TH008]MBU8784999.1 TraR/DksA C4-type zinc finger protein [Bacillus glycinifermentans]MDU0071107.1 TraR/DksA C4-type zinc finger protein [Bacillus sp. IG6]MED8018975.1 TraR/DksA C4-type zinc finger protein [Bacillus glycinifermentans]NUJ15174.1 general stress protein [Bacillus glycinifermentans]
MPLTNEQKEQLYHRLMDLKKSLSDREAPDQSMTEETGELSNGVDNHLADHAGVYFERMREQTFEQTDRNVLQEVEDALERMEDGTYGICEKTGREIPYERLKAVPYARYVIEAQREAEKINESGAADDREFSRQMRDLTNKETMDQKHSYTYERLDQEQDSK